MQDQLSTRAEKGVTIGQEAVKVLLKEPIKEAVKETLAEEEIVTQKSAVAAAKQRDNEHSIGQIRDDQSEVDTEHEKIEVQSEHEESTDSGSSLLDPKVLIPAVTLVGVAIALRRLGEGSLGSGNIEEMLVGDDDVPMEEDMSKSSPSDPENSTFSDDGSEEVSA